jgi:hypothetical protein
MRQIAPDPEALVSLLARLKYKEGWTFTLVDIDRDQGSEGLTLVINIRCRDTYDTSRLMSVNHYMIVPPAAYDERSWCRWLLDQVLLVEQHESCEFFQIGPVRPYAPNHAPGNNPYTIFDQGTREGAETDFRGNPKPTR